ncbi:MAG: glycosyltransferase [Candidatus Hodarchaeota archaeon]
MKILHISDVGLPEARLERSAIYAKQKGWEVVFAGGKPVERQIFNAFEKIYYRPWKAYEKTGLPGTLQNTRRWLRRVLHEEKPDLIHAHDLFAGKLALDMGYPFVYDDHEIWASRIALDETHALKRDRTLLRRLGTKVAVRSWRKWEPEILRAAPVLVVSEEIADFYRNVQSQCFVIPNVPTTKEVEMIPANINIDDEFRIGIVAREKVSLNQRRDRVALQVWLENRFGASLVFIGPPVINTEEVKNYGLVSHQEMLRILSTCDAALLGQWTQLPLFSFQIRFSLVLHAGLKVIQPFNRVTQVKFCDRHNAGWSWKSSDQLKNLLKELTREYFADVDHWNREKQRIRKVAQHYLIWSDYADQLEKAYEAALSNK